MQYIESRIANLIASEKYVVFRMKTTETTVEFDARKSSEFNRQVRHDLIAEEKFSEEELGRFSTAGCLQTTVLDALTQGVIKPQLSGKKRSAICMSNSSVPNFKRKIPVCILCDKPRHKKVFVDDDGMDALDALK